jgi:hypothetical protein
LNNNKKYAKDINNTGYIDEKILIKKPDEKN